MGGPRTRGVVTRPHAHRRALTRARRYPLLALTTVFRSLWNLLLKPLIRKILLMKGGGAAAPVGELPGGSY